MKTSENQISYTRWDAMSALCCFTFIIVLGIGYGSFEHLFYDDLYNRYTADRDFLFFHASHTHQWLMVTLLLGMFTQYILRSKWLAKALASCALINCLFVVYDATSYKLLTPDGLKTHTPFATSLSKEETSVETQCYATTNRSGPDTLHLSYILHFADGNQIDLFDSHADRPQLEGITEINTSVEKIGLKVIFQPPGLFEFACKRRLMEVYPHDYTAIEKLLRIP